MEAKSRIPGKVEVLLLIGVSSDQKRGHDENDRRHWRAWVVDAAKKDEREEDGEHAGESIRISGTRPVSNVPWDNG